MIDWSLARQAARFAGGSDERVDLGVDVVSVCAELEGPVAEYTGLTAATPIPAPELLSRSEWSALNLEAIEPLLDPVSERLDDKFGAAGPLAGVLRGAASGALAVEVGLAIGYVSGRVLGQYELSLLGAERPPRLVLVAPNLDKAVERMEVDRAAFVTWVCAHELTHVLQFQGVPWLREHLAGLLRRYMATLEVRIEGAGSGGLSLPDPAKLAAQFREGGLAALVQTEDQREVMAEVQATMAVIEGYCEHAMDALAERMLPSHEELRAAMDRRRRSRSAPERLIERLLGFDVKLRQYELGKTFCDGVVTRAGMAGLNQVWESPEALPDLAELERPEKWLARVGGSAAAA